MWLCILILAYAIYDGLGSLTNAVKGNTKILTKISKQQEEQEK